MYDPIYNSRNSIYPNELAECIKKILSDTSRKNVNRQLLKMFRTCPPPNTYFLKGHCGKIKCPFANPSDDQFCFMNGELEPILNSCEVKDNNTLAKVLLLLTRYLAKWEAISRYRKNRLSRR